jgi:hypothetical protein
MQNQGSGNHLAIIYRTISGQSPGLGGKETVWRSNCKSGKHDATHGSGQHHIRVFDFSGGIDAYRFVQASASAVRAGLCDRREDAPGSQILGEFE